MDQSPSLPPAPQIPASAVTSATTVTDTPVDVTRLIAMLYQDVEQQIARCDFKAQITLSTSAVFAAVMTNLGLGVKSWSFTEAHGVELVALLAWIAAALCLCFAIGYALTAAFPRSLGRGTAPAADPNLYFSAHITQLSSEEYARRFCAQSNHDVKERVLHQIHVKSRVLEAKMRSVRRGLRLLVAALACWALARLLFLIATGAVVAPQQTLST
jgi:hypothetical protein